MSGNQFLSVEDYSPIVAPLDSAHGNNRHNRRYYKYHEAWQYRTARTQSGPQPSEPRSLQAAPSSLLAVRSTASQIGRKLATVVARLLHARTLTALVAAFG